MPLRTGGRLLLFACVVLVVLAGTASAGSVDRAVVLDDPAVTNTSVDTSADTATPSPTPEDDGTTVSVSVDANDSGVSASADVGTNDSDAGATLDGSANDSDAGATLDGSANDSGVSADGDVSADGTNVSVSADASTNDTSVSVGADAELEGATGTPARSPSEASTEAPAETPTSAGPGSTPGAGGSGEDGSGDEPTQSPTAPASGLDGGENDGSGAGSGLPTEATAGVGLVAVVVGAALARRSVSAVSTGVTPLAAVYEALVAASYWLRAKLIALVPLRYSRRDGSDPLEHEVRADLHDAVETAPGVHLSKLEDDVDVSLSSVRHHLRVLEDEDLVESERIRGKRRYFPAYASNTDLRAALDEPATASVLRTLATQDSATVSDLADALGRDPSTISHHLSRLEDDGLVEREREGQAVVTRLADTPERVLADEDAIEATSSAD